MIMVLVVAVMAMVVMVVMEILAEIEMVKAVDLCIAIRLLRLMMVDVDGTGRRGELGGNGQHS